MNVPEFDTKEELEAYLENPTMENRTHNQRMIAIKWLPKILGAIVLVTVLYLFYPKWGETSPGRKWTGEIVHRVMDFFGYDTSIFDGAGEL